MICLLSVWSVCPVYEWSDHAVRRTQREMIVFKVVSAVTIYLCGVNTSTVIVAPAGATVTVEVLIPRPLPTWGARNCSHLALGNPHTFPHPASKVSHRECHQLWNHLRQSIGINNRGIHARDTVVISCNLIRVFSNLCQGLFFNIFHY